jgi:hypothetical protein
MASQNFLPSVSKIVLDLYLTSPGALELSHTIAISMDPRKLISGYRI